MNRLKVEKNLRKGKNGITLIALVITIIVLLILAGVALSMLSGENSVLKRSAQAKESTDRAQIIEEAKVEILGNVAGNEGRISETDAKEILGKYFNGVPEDLTELETNMTTKNGGYGVKLKEVLGNTTIAGNNPGSNPGSDPVVAELPKVAGTVPYKPSASFKQLAGTDLSTGLVITDATDTTIPGNEYVWIEVPNNKLEGASSVTNGPDYTAVTSSTDYTHIAEALRAYCTTDKDGNQLIKNGTSSDGINGSTSTYGYTDTWYSGCGIADSDAYTTLYNKMLKSVYENGGFWIGRYEAGTGTARNSGDSASGITPLSKIDQYPINWVTCSEAQAIASNVPNKGSYNSSLMFGIQWDLVLKHLKNKGVTVTELTSDSSSWGNYSDSDLFTVTHGKYAMGKPWARLDLTDWTSVSNEYTKQAMAYPDVGYTVFSTGATTRNMKKNIYDLAGNMFEWTLEKTSNTYSPGAIRGGYFDVTGSGNPASVRGCIVASTSFYGYRFQSLTLLSVACMTQNGYLELHKINKLKA